MNFLSRFKQDEMARQSPAASYEPVRRRSFSASRYREEELARAAEDRAAHEAAEAAAEAAAERVRNQRLADAEEERLAAAMPEDNDLAGDPPMEWEEAVGWLSTRSAEARNYVAQHWNWEQDLRVLQFLVAQPDIDKGVATGIFWLTGATDDFFPWGDEDNPDDPQFRRAMEMVASLGMRFAAEDFATARFGFDDSWDCSQLKERLEELYLDGRIEWSPAQIDTVSPGPQPTLDDVPQDERAEVRDFLRRNGAG